MRRKRGTTRSKELKETLIGPGDITHFRRRSEGLYYTARICHPEAAVLLYYRKVWAVELLLRTSLQPKCSSTGSCGQNCPDTHSRFHNFLVSNHLSRCVSVGGPSTRSNHLVTMTGPYACSTERLKLAVEAEQLKSWLMYSLTDKHQRRTKCTTASDTQR